MKQNFILKKQIPIVIFVAFFLSMFCAGCGNGKNTQSYLAASGAESAQEQEALTSCAEGEHIWGEPIYTWSNDGSSCTAVRTCTVPGCEKTESETTEVNKESQAVFKNEAFAPQDQTTASENPKPSSSPPDPSSSEDKPADDDKSSSEKEIGTSPVFVVSDAQGAAGEQVKITVSLANNPGIIAAALDVTYDQSKLKLIKSEDSGLLAKPTFSENTNKYPYYVSWNDALASDNNLQNGILVTLTFEILKGATGTAEVSVGYNPGDVFDYDLNDVSFQTISGKITIR